MEERETAFSQRFVPLALSPCLRSSVMSIAPGITGIGEYIFSGFEFWING